MIRVRSDEICMRVVVLEILLGLFYTEFKNNRMI
jgi:hypothetical protein